MSGKVFIFKVLYKNKHSPDTCNTKIVKKSHLLPVQSGSTHKKIRKDSVINNLSVWLLITCVVLRQCKCVSLPQKRHDKSSHFFAPVF